MKTNPVGAELFHADSRRDVTKLSVAFRNLAYPSWAYWRSISAFTWEYWDTTISSISLLICTITTTDAAYSILRDIFTPVSTNTHHPISSFIHLPPPTDPQTHYFTQRIFRVTSRSIFHSITQLTQSVTRPFIRRFIYSTNSTINSFTQWGSWGFWRPLPTGCLLF